MVASWTMSSLPVGWQTDEPQVGVATSQNRLVLRTTPGTTAYQLLGPEMTLYPGRYIAAVDGQVSRGGLGIGALDVTRDSWINIASFSGPQGRAVAMPVTFSVYHPTVVRIILMNYRARRASSTWTLLRVVIAGPGATAVNPSAAASTRGQTTSVR